MMITPNEKAALIGAYIARNDWHGYSQVHRNDYTPNETVDFGDGVPVVLQREMDCSKLVIICYQAQGIDTGEATYTGDLYKLLDTGNFISVPVEQCRRGDILNTTKNHHAALYIGNGELVEAHHGDYAGGLDGIAGDQDGTEIRITDYYNDEWTACYRCVYVNAKGWIKEDGRWHYYKENGELLRNGWVQWRSIWYYMDQYGNAVKDKWIHDGDWYYFKSDKSMAKDEPVKHHLGWAWAGHDGKIIQEGTLSIENGLIQI